MQQPDPIIAYSLFFVLNSYIDNSDIPKKEWVNAEEDSRLGFLFNPEEWQNAVIFLRHLHHRVLVLDNGSIYNGKNAIGTYQGRFVIDHLPRKTIASLVSKIKFPNANPYDQHLKIEDYWQEDFIKVAVKFYQKLDAALGTKNFYQKFTTGQVKKVGVKDLRNLPKLFQYPALMEFSPAAVKELNAKIMKGQIPTRIIDYYFGANDSYSSAVSLFQPVEYVIKNTDDSHLLWTAGDLYNIIWRCLPDDEILESNFKKRIYSLYWPRIGDVWPIINSSRIVFRREDDQNEFEDSLGWLFSLNNISELNHEIGRYLNFLKDFPVQQQISERIPDPIISRAFWQKYHDLPAEKMHDYIISELPKDYVAKFISHPDTIAEAKLSLEDILIGVFEIHEVPYVTEKLFLNAKPTKVNAFIINYFSEHLAEFVELFETYREFDRCDRDVTISMFQALCDNAATAEEFIALDTLAEKLRLLPIMAEFKSEYFEDIDVSLNFALRSVKDFTRAREQLIQYVAY